MTLKNKIALVTGAGQGIGKTIALSLAKKGANIVIADINQSEAQITAEEIKKIGNESLASQCDVSKKTEITKLMNQLAQKFGKIDILINNAGIFPFVPFEKITESDWDKVLNINLKSMFLLSQEAVKTMPENGKIINISSIAAFIGFESLTHYCASKGGVNSFTRALALELAPKKINVNAIAPGAIETPGASKMTDEKAKQQTIAMIPLKRMGQPEDIANLAVFLSSDEANYITGQTIIVDGGWILR